MDIQLGLFDDQPQVGEYPIPADARPGRCRSCEAEIAWIRTPNGKAMPLSLKTARTIGDVRYAMSHFVDCEQAREWQRR